MTVLIRPSDLRGESWETRRELGLTEDKHYVGITSNTARICNHLNDKVTHQYYCYPLNLLATADTLS